MKRVLVVALLVALLAFGGAIVGRWLTVGYEKAESAVSSDTVRLELERSFVEAYRNRISIRVALTVDEAMREPLPAKLDGDLHFAGRAPEAGLPAVAEIANAAEEDSAVGLIHRAEATHRAVDVVGPWRVWPEHPVKGGQTQGAPIEPLESANPDHTFEIHPVVRLEGIDLARSFHPVDGYKPPTAPTAFSEWEKAQYTMTITSDKIVLVTRAGLQNDAKFFLQLGPEPQVEVEDGRFVLGSIFDENGKVLAQGLRLGFAKGTPPELAVRALSPGARVQVWGLPRVSFDELARRSASTSAGTLSGKLPYELIILGIYPNP